MQLRYSTVTGVARDDLPDEGAWLYAETIREIHRQSPGTGVEILVPDFSGNPDHLGEVFSARPEVFAHNVETVPRIFKRIRPAFRYERSLDVITQGRDAGLIKSNLILGMGEERDEVSQALRDLHDAGTDIITITQYLRPSPRHLPVDRWVRPEEFVSSRRRPRRSASSVCSPVRSCARRTERVSGPSRCTRRGASCPRARPPRRRLARLRAGGGLAARRPASPSRTRSEAAFAAGILVTMARTKDKTSARRSPAA